MIANCTALVYNILMRVRLSSLTVIALSALIPLQAMAAPSDSGGQSAGVGANGRGEKGNRDKEAKIPLLPAFADPEGGSFARFPGMEKVSATGSVHTPFATLENMDLADGKFRTGSSKLNVITGQYDPGNLTMESILQPDESVILISNVDSTAYIVDPEGQVSEIENDELLGTTGGTRTSDGRNVLVQTHLMTDKDNPADDVRSKRLAQLNGDGSVTVLVNLPAGTADSSAFKAIPKVDAGGNPILDGEGNQVLHYLPIDTQMSVAEDVVGSAQGGATAFVVSDRLSRVIHKVASDASITSIEGLNYPLSVGTDSEGTIYYVTSPLLDPATGEVLRNPQLRAIDPTDGTDEEVFTFTGNEVSYQTESYIRVTVDSQEYDMPSGRNIEMEVTETKSKVHIDVTDAHAGTVDRVTIKKEPGK